jgi:RNA polymerase primary sigma factor
MSKNFNRASFYWFKTYNQEVFASVPLSADEERDLAISSKTGSASAREQLICANMRLVIKIATSSHIREHNIYDLIAEGAWGLIQAVDHYDPTRNVRLATYASPWIRQQIWRYIEKNTGPLRIPSVIRQKASKLNTIKSDLSQELGRTPSTKELAEEIGLSESNITDLEKVIPMAISLDTEVSEGVTISDIIPEEKQTSTTSSYPRISQQEINKILLKLPSRERRILTLRFGLDGTHPLSLREIAEKEEISSERVRQLQERALKKLRRSNAWE